MALSRMVVPRALLRSSIGIDFGIGIGVVGRTKVGQHPVAVKLLGGSTADRQPRRWNSTACGGGRLNPSRSISASSRAGEKLATAKAPQVPRHDWNRAVSEAEQIVGYPTSFLNLRFLLSDEIANVALHLRKLIGSNHPLLKSAKSLIYNDKSQQAWGLIILLVSKAAGHTASVPETDHDSSVGVLHSQRALAEVTEMIRSSQLIHNGIINLQSMDNAGNNLSGDSDMIFGNKIALLGGDYLLAHASKQIATLRNQDLNMLMTSAYRDLAESAFIGDTDDQNIPLPSKPTTPPGTSTPECTLEELDFGDVQNNKEPLRLDGVMGHPEKEWSLRHVLGGGSLLGKSCHGALMLAGHPEELQKQGYLFGKHMSLAWQASIELQPFLHNELPLGAQFSLVSAPVLFHLEYDPEIYGIIEKGRTSVEDVDYVALHNEVIRGPGLERTRNLQKKHSMAAMNVLTRFPSSDAQTALLNIIMAMQQL
ncbi:all trans-polyprenyl-diphosphate synthase PDSS2-like [Uranotaenia lowii]|uniref:all trans-polyprenyl-diphosphate synthase PDSS2-like n=1 Tax=Uranotaenia lowii TaxID=190385 RepID=UPI0024785F9A|nr:all trans-polyprenyl-diphosphate synthase PDSS2-like [Uranotaenia lowii]